MSEYWDVYDKFRNRTNGLQFPGQRRTIVWNRFRGKETDPVRGGSLGE